MMLVGFASNRCVVVCYVANGLIENDISLTLPWLEVKIDFFINVRDNLGLPTQNFPTKLRRVCRRKMSIVDSANTSNKNYPTWMKGQAKRLFLFENKSMKWCGYRLLLFQHCSFLLTSLSLFLSFFHCSLLPDDLRSSRQIMAAIP